MARLDWLKVLILAAIWGGSFALLRVAAPVFGAVPTACLRVLISGIALTTWFLISRKPLQLKLNLQHYLVMGITNAAIPFLCFSFAALHIPAGLSVILNATAPLFAIVFAAVFLADALTPRKLIGFTTGFCGVAFIAIRGELVFDDYSVISILCCLLAALGYAGGGVYLRYQSLKNPGQIDQTILTGVSQLFAGLLLLPFSIAQVYQHPVNPAQITPLVIFCILTLAFVCSSLAFVIFYQLIARSGPTKAFAVSYLMPVFGILWGVLFLDEHFTKAMFIGCALIFIGITFANLKKKTTSSSQL